MYEATEIGDVVDSSGQFTPSGQETVDQHVYSPINIPVQTPPTAKSANSKVRSRKGVPVVQFDEYGEIGTDSRRDRHKRVRLWVDCEDVANAEELFEVGKNYKIEGFIVEPFIGRYWCMNEDKHIVLTAATQVLPLPDAWGLISSDICSFTNLSSIGEV
ncbi:hypothetical protein AgCh_022184 [Apium graveolens]